MEGVIEGETVISLILNHLTHPHSISQSISRWQPPPGRFISKSLPSYALWALGVARDAEIKTMPNILERLLCARNF